MGVAVPQGGLDVVRVAREMVNCVPEYPYTGKMSVERLKENSKKSSDG